MGVWRAAVEEGVEGLVEAARRVETVAGLWALASAYRWLEYRELLPVRVEPWLPGWAGFKGGRPDLLVGPFPVELVTGGPGSWGFERKAVALAAYALMVERLLGVPVDLGYVVSLSEGRAYAVCIGDDVRLEALKLASMVEGLDGRDPGLPESPSHCPEACPFRSICWGGGVEAPRGEARVESRVEEGAG